MIKLHNPRSYKLTRIRRSKIGLVTLNTYEDQRSMVEARSRRYPIEAALSVIADETLRFINTHNSGIWNQL